MRGSEHRAREGSNILISNAIFFFFLAALARLFHSAGAKVILASRNVQQLQRIKFQMENDHIQKV